MDTTRIKLKCCLTVLCLICFAGLAPAASPAAAADNQGELEILWIWRSGTLPRPLCVGETMPIPVVLASEGPGNYISGATITLNGKNAAITDGSGTANAPYKAEKVGPFTLSIGASKSGYTSATPLSLKGEAQDCGWRIRMWYEEEVHTSAGNFFEASCFLKFANQSFTRDENDNLVLTTGESMIPAQYGCDTGGLEYPLRVTMSPKIEGTVNVQFSGKYVKGILQITLQAFHIALPQQVSIQVEDAVRGSSGLPPVTWAMQPYADIIKKAGITNWNANPIFDYKIYTAEKSLFFAESGLKLSGGDATVIVELDKPSK